MSLHGVTGVSISIKSTYPEVRLVLYRPSRRRFWTSLARGSLIAGINALAPRWVLPKKPRAAFEHFGSLDGALRTDPETLRSYAQDYGQIIHEMPRAVLMPESVEDIARMIVFARRTGLRIAVRGNGHQPFGQAQVAGGLVIDLRSLHRIHSVSAGRAEVDAGADWSSVLAATLDHGVVPPVLTNYLGLTVGGTLSVGGVGPTTFRHGAQVDQVDELHVVTGEGRQVRCSPARHRALFEAVLAGQGQCAVITRAVLRLIDAPSTVREYLLPYSAFAPLLADGIRLASENRFQGIKAVAMPAGGSRSYALTGFATAPDGRDDAARLKGLHHVHGEEEIRTITFAEYAGGLPPVPTGSCHADLGLCLPASAVDSFVTEMLPRLNPDDLGAAAAVSVSFWKRKHFRAPLFRVPAADDVVYLLFLRHDTSDGDVVARMLNGNRMLFERARRAGGTLYPYSALRMTRYDWQQHYGESWQNLRLAKCRYDPARVLACGPDTL
jgi:FAD/FMN-containing dehydrogenase